MGERQRQPAPMLNDLMSATGKFDTTNILVVGTGGQGVMTATEILAEAAIALGHDVKKTEVAGMAQRGGVVSSHLRFGRKCCRRRSPPARPTCCSASRPPRRCAGAHAAPEGLVLMNTGRLVPPVVELGLYDYPDDPVAEMRAAGTRVFSFDAIGDRPGTRRHPPRQYGDARRHRRPPALPGRSARTLHPQALRAQESRTRRTQPAAAQAASSEAATDAA
jgi:hypothetical protein